MLITSRLEELVLGTENALVSSPPPPPSLLYVTVAFRYAYNDSTAVEGCDCI